MAGQMLDALMQTLALPVAGGIFFNQLDELFIDANYFFRGLHRRSARVVSKEALRTVPQKRIAIMVPAWRESDVIEHMLLHNLKTLDYDPDRYVIFCGTYRNDLETQACVDAVAKRFRSIRKVVVPHDGPTSKADCLNWIYQAILLEERKRGHRFDILLMQDAEDVIHPLSLRLYSLLIPEHEFVQTPVFSLGLSAKKLVAGTYIDEFAEHHLKDMLVRQAIGGLVPSAGVGTAFDRNAFEEVARQHGQFPFNTESLTEDYEIGLKLRLANRKVAFACRTVLCESEKAGAPEEEEYIATREYFPDAFAASVRQRSRWICGITLQTWAQIGWKGSLPVLYCLWRDRKAPLMNALLLGAYVLLLYLGLRWAFSPWLDSGWSVDNVIPTGSPLSLLVTCNLGLMLWRFGMKLALVRRLYGLSHGLMSIPRLLVSNVVNVAATGRAVWQYAHHRLTRKPLRWLKTVHAFPTAQVLEAQRPRLGQLLLDSRAVTETSLKEALSAQPKTGLPLGRVLVSSGAASNRAVVRALAAQFELEVADLDPSRPSLSLLRSLPEDEAERLGVLPLGEENGQVVVATSLPLPPEARSALSSKVGADLLVRLAPEKWLTRARLRTYRRLFADTPAQTERLGEWLLHRGLLDSEQLTDVLDEHWESGDAMGELLLRRGLVDEKTLQAALPDVGARFVGFDTADIDKAAIDRIGIGFAALYALVPLRPGALGCPRAIVSAFPLHGEIIARLGACLQTPISPFLGSYGEILGALGRHLATAPSGRTSYGLRGFDLDGLLRQVDLEPSHERRSSVSLITGARRSESTARDTPTSRGLLPARLIFEAKILIEDIEGTSLVLSCEKPLPRLSRELNWLLPTWKIAWRARSHNDNGGRRNAIEGGRLIETVA